MSVNIQRINGNGNPFEVDRTNNPDSYGPRWMRKLDGEHRFYFADVYQEVPTTPPRRRVDLNECEIREDGKHLCFLGEPSISRGIVGVLATNRDYRLIIEDGWLSKLDKLFLEISQFTNAKTARELWLEKRRDVLGEALEAIAQGDKDPQALALQVLRETSDE